MTAIVWFLLGLWVGVGAGVMLFACLQVSRDGERPKRRAPQAAAEHEHLSSYPAPVARRLRWSMRAHSAA
jgi:hypothetical protein